MIQRPHKTPIWRKHMNSAFCRKYSDDTWILISGITVWQDHMKSSFCREYSDAILIFTFGTSTLMGPHEIKDWNPNHMIHHTVGSISMKYWFLYLDQTLWREHMNSAFCRKYSDDTWMFITGMNSLTGQHEIIFLSEVLRCHTDIYFWDKHPDGTTWNQTLKS